MKKIITAIGNNTLFEKLKKSEKYEVLSRDIQYKEGVLEYLNENNFVDILIISELLEGEIPFRKLITEIQKKNLNIDIIVFIDSENKELKEFLYDKGIYKIYKNNQVNIEDLDNILDNNDSKSTEELNKEILKLKRIIEEQKEQNDNSRNQAKITAVTGYYDSRQKYFIMYDL